MITSNEDSLFNKHFILKGIMTIRDIIDEYGVPLSWQDAQQKYSLNLSCFSMVWICNKSIPTTWKDELLRNNRHPSGNNRNEHYTVTSKTAYQRLLKPIKKPPTAQNLLISLLGLPDIDWKKVYMLPWQATIESSLCSFQYKILNNILYLNEKLFKFKIVDSPLCSLCETENASVLHLFCACAVRSNLLEQFKLWVSDISLSDNINIDPQTIIFGAWNINTPDFILINHMILLFKRYIYLRRQDRHGPNVIGLKSFIKNIETAECRIASDKENLSFHYKKMGKLLPFLWNNLITRVNGVQWRNFKLLMAVIQRMKSACCSKFARPYLRTYVLMMLPNLSHPDYSFQFLAYTPLCNSSLLLPTEIRL